MKLNTVILLVFTFLSITAVNSFPTYDDDTNGIAKLSEKTPVFKPLMNFASYDPNSIQNDQHNENMENTKAETKIREEKAEKATEATITEANRNNSLQKSSAKTPEFKSDWSRTRALYNAVLKFSPNATRNEDDQEINKFFDDMEKAEAEMKQRHEEIKRENEYRRANEAVSTENVRIKGSQSSHNDDVPAVIMLIILGIFFITLFVLALMGSPFAKCCLECIFIFCCDDRPRHTRLFP